PKLPTAPARIYLDMEGDPEEGFTYLIGFVVYDGERVERHSLWSDDPKGEAEIFSRFLDIVARYTAPQLYCYGSYKIGPILTPRGAMCSFERNLRRGGEAARRSADTGKTAICGRHTEW